MKYERRTYSKEAAHLHPSGRPYLAEMFARLLFYKDIIERDDDGNKTAVMSRDRYERKVKPR